MADRFLKGLTPLNKPPKRNGRRIYPLRAIIFLFLASAWLWFMARPLRLIFIYALPPRLYLKDFMQEWLMARAALSGINPYLPLAELAGKFFGSYSGLIGLGLPSPHPPPAVIFALPFGMLEYRVAASAWMVLELGCMAASVYIVLAWWLGRRPGPVRLVFAVLPVLILAPFWEDLLCGQLSSVALLLLLCSWRGRSQVFSGFFLGASLSLKMMGAPFLLFSLLRRRWQEAYVAFAVFLLCNAAAAAIIGVENVVHYYRLVAPEMAQIYRLVEWNFSVWTLGWRLFSGVGGPFSASNEILPLFEIPSFAPYASTILVFVLLFAGLFVAVRSRDRDLSYSMLFCITAVTGPIAWIHYLVLLLLPLCLVVRRLVESGFPIIATALFAVTTTALAVPDYVLVNTMARFDINPGSGGGATVSFWAGLFVLVPLFATLLLAALVAWIGPGRGETQWARLFTRRSSLACGGSEAS